MSMKTSEIITINTGENDSSSQFVELSKILVECSGKLRKEICDIYGFKLLIDGDNYIASHDGRKIGAGSISVNGRTYHFEIKPKNSGILFSELTNLFGHGLDGYYGNVHSFTQSGSTDIKSEYSFSYLLGLLSDLSNFGTHFFNIYSSRKRVISKGKPKGRIVPFSFVKSQLMGKFDQFECEVLDNSNLRLFATVFYHTAMSVSKELEFWTKTTAMSGIEAENMKKSVVAKLKPYIVDGFSQQLISRLSRPPFPFGVRELFSKCLRYWKSNGDISCASAGPKMNFSGFSIKLDALFEDYAGILFARLFNNCQHLPKNRYEYAREIDNVRQLEPDHIFVDIESKRLIIVEVKYSNNIAVREHVAQLIAYLDYKYAGLEAYDKIGILVYPGLEPECTYLDSFSHNISVAKINSNIDNCILSLNSFVN